MKPYEKEWPGGVLTDREQEKRKKLHREAAKGSLAEMSWFSMGALIFLVPLYTLNLSFIEVVNPLAAEQLMFFQFIVGLLWLIISFTVGEKLFDYILRKYFEKELRFQLADHNVGHILIDVDKSNYKMRDEVG